MSNLLQRIITALLGVGLILAALLYGHLTFALAFLIIMVLTLREFYGLARKSGSNPFHNWGLLFSVALYALVYAVLSNELSAQWLWLLLPLLFLCFIFPLYYLERTHPIQCLAITLLGVIYIAVPFCLLLVVGFSGAEYDFSLILGLLLAQWASDSGAYIAGKTLGRTKLFEKVSPNKTWEGTIGGALIALGILYTWSIYFNSLQTLEWLGLALIVVIFGSFGDLVESLFKRSLAIKDSGSAIPGHGGFLDRFDGLLLALPFATAYIMMLS